MTTTTIALSSGEQTTLNALLSALPEQYAAFDCATYLKYRPTVETALPLIEKIPVYGSNICKVLKLLIQLANSICPGPQQAKPSAGSINCPGCSGSDNPTALDLLKHAGILQSDVTLDQLVEFQKKLSGLPTSAHSVIISQFIYDKPRC